VVTVAPERACAAGDLKTVCAPPYPGHGWARRQACGKRWDPLRCRLARRSTQTLGFGRSAGGCAEGEKGQAPVVAS